MVYNRVDTSNERSIFCYIGCSVIMIWEWQCQNGAVSSPIDTRANPTSHANLQKSYSMSVCCGPALAFAQICSSQHSNHSSPQPLLRQHLASRRIVSLKAKSWLRIRSSCSQATATRSSRSRLPRGEYLCCDFFIELRGQSGATQHAREERRAAGTASSSTASGQHLKRDTLKDTD